MNASVSGSYGSTARLMSDWYEVRSQIEEGR